MVVIKEVGFEFKKKSQKSTLKSTQKSAKKVLNGKNAKKKWF